MVLNSYIPIFSTIKYQNIPSNSGAKVMLYQIYIYIYCVNTAFVSLLTTSPYLSQYPPFVHTTFGCGCVLVIE